MAFPVEANIPMPDPQGAALRMYPFGEMQVGDSFFVGCPHAGWTRVAQRLRNAAARFRRQVPAENARRFTIRSVDGGVRCWRIA